MDYGPFDLLVLDGGGAGKVPGDVPVNPGQALAPCGTLVIDDFTRPTTAGPRARGLIDKARLHWLEHPDLRATEVQVAPGTVTIVATRR